MVTLFLRQGETGKQVLLSFPVTTPTEKENVVATLETLKPMSKTVTIQGAASEVMNLGLYLSGVDLVAEGEVASMIILNPSGISSKKCADKVSIVNLTSRVIFFNYCHFLLKTT